MWRILCLALLPAPALADSVVATRTIRAQTIITPQDVTMVDAAIPGALGAAEAAVGLEARIAIYAGRPVHAEDLGSAAIIARNQIVPIRFRAGALEILAEGRAMERGSVGDVIRVMNLGSRTTVNGRIEPDGQVQVGPNP